MITENERAGIDKLSRFQIETLLAYDYVGRNKPATAHLLHISYYCVCQDLLYVRVKTGLNPVVKEDCDRLVEIINEIRKEKDGRDTLPLEVFFGEEP